MMLDDATRARLEQAQSLHGARLLEGDAQVARADIAAILAAYDALVAERAQAAPVLAAADRCDLPPLAGAHWINVVVRQNGADVPYEADWLKPLQAALVAWRAAREG